ncbi:hypothetical protein [Amphibacillus cookii]|uniref:hypothetical protein n=1 Tax=Amphibacillus cookii TaxID=767787 RepID=UPI00195D4584|nr:hypothetical protein [Amphibacillus cookii]MBM7541289.1 succinate dehydrogenase flavin-adding protein (antitoxin of CptAB toxin-antitoxin module) [Amphibacillus cookii]
MNKVTTNNDLVKDILQEIQSNEYKYFTEQEIQLLMERDKEILNWFKTKSLSSKSCSICFGRNCKVDFDKDDDFLPCPYGENEIIEITESDKVGYIFKMDALLHNIREVLGLEGERKRYSSFRYIGEKSIRDDNWSVAFSFGKYSNHSLGEAFEFHLQKSSIFTLIIFDEIPTYVSENNELLKQLGIYYIPFDLIQQDTIENLYEEFPDDIQIRKTLINVENEVSIEKVTVSELWKHATAGNKGDQFEDSVLQIIKKAFYNVIPFGSLYKGMAIPDGLIMNKNKEKISTLFYDCKSFSGDEYKHKAATPMQVNYYQSFLESFYKQGYNNSGFVIFSSEYPDDVKKQITGSAQWDFVQQNNKVFFLSVRGLEKLDYLLKEFDSHDVLNTSVLFELLFERNGEYILSDSLKDKYYKLFHSDSQDNFFFISPEHIEVAIIISMLQKVSEKYADEGIRKHLKETMRKAQHTNKKGRIKKPQISSFVEKMIDVINKKEELALHPLSILIFLDHQDDEMCNYFGEEKYDEIYEGYDERTSCLIVDKN